jgi:hypothetical protein
MLDTGYSAVRRPQAEKLETNLGHRQASIEVYPPEAESSYENQVHLPMQNRLNILSRIWSSERS